MSNNYDNSIYQLNCSHCGEYISFDSENGKNNKCWQDPNLGEIKVNNIHLSSGPTGSYESMDTELTCPRCHYTFKSTVRRNFQ